MAAANEKKISFPKKGTRNQNIQITPLKATSRTCRGPGRRVLLRLRLSLLKQLWHCALPVINAIGQAFGVRIALNLISGRAIDRAMNATPDSAISVRAYEPKDKAICLAIFDSNVGKYFAPYERARFEVFLSDLPGPYFVIERANDVIACGGYGPHKQDDTIAVLSWGMVQLAHHRSGIGRVLTRVRLKRIEGDKRVTRVRLRTSQHTSGFYEKLGFKIIEVKTDGIALGIDECVMERECI